MAHATARARYNRGIFHSSVGPTKVLYYEKMSDSGDIEENITPPDVLATATKMTNHLLLEKSRKAYDIMLPRIYGVENAKMPTTFLENVLLPELVG